MAEQITSSVHQGSVVASALDVLTAAAAHARFIGSPKTAAQAVINRVFGPDIRQMADPQPQAVAAEQPRRGRPPGRKNRPPKPSADPIAKG